MNSVSKAHHDIKGDIHNIMTLLKFIQEEEKIQDPTLSEMLEKCIEREERIKGNLNTLEYILKEGR